MEEGPFAMQKTPLAAEARSLRPGFPAPSGPSKAEVLSDPTGGTTEIGCCI